MASQRKNDNPGGNTGGNAQNGNRPGGSRQGGRQPDGERQNAQQGGGNRQNDRDDEQNLRNTGRGRDDDDRADDRTGQRMAAQQDANRQADLGNTQDGEQIEQGSRDGEGMGRQRQNDGGKRGSQFRET